MPAGKHSSSDIERQQQQLVVVAAVVVVAVVVEQLDVDSTEPIVVSSHSKSKKKSC